MSLETTLAAYIGDRILNAGCKCVFTVSGDYCLAFLKDLIQVKGLSLIPVCNELNGGYAADGYSRATNSLAVLVVNFMVGSLSAINAVAGAYSDDIPLLLICFSPSLHNYCRNRVMHHTSGEYGLNDSFKCYTPVVGKTFVIRHEEDISSVTDSAFRYCLSMRKPVYLGMLCLFTPFHVALITLFFNKEISCDLAAVPVSNPNPLPVPSKALSDATSLEACLTDCLRCLDKAVSVVVVGGSKLRADEGAVDAFSRFVESIGCAVAMQPAAKGIFNESHEQYIGCFWGSVSDPCCEEIVESADLVIYIGTVFNDYSTTGWSTLSKPAQTITVSNLSVAVNRKTFSGIQISDFCNAISHRTSLKLGSLEAYRRYSPQKVLRQSELQSAEPLRRNEIVAHIQNTLSSTSAVLTETGDCWFIGKDLKLPKGASYHIQMQYGSIGWSVGASLGLGLGYKNKRRVIAIIGDGSFQIAAQELSSILRNQIDIIIFLINNRGYTIETEIHDGPYNYIPNWKYFKLIEAFSARASGQYEVKGLQIKSSLELDEALTSIKDRQGTYLLECCIERDDCSSDLLKWGSRVAAANMAKPTL